MSAVERTINCRKHGRAKATYVCQHLSRGTGLGFYCAEAAGDPYPDAWCGKCWQTRLSEGGTQHDEAEADATVTLLCHLCYEEVRERNKLA